MASLSSISLAATDLMVNISGEYPALYDFTLLLSAFLGFFGAGYVLVLQLRVSVFGTVPKTEFSWGKVIPALFICSAMIAFPFTLLTIGNSLFDNGYGSLFPPSAITQDLASNPAKMLAKFSEMTARIIGYFFGLWGLVGAYHSQLPNGNKEGLRPGAVRVLIGTMLILARDFGNLFMGMGDRIFG